MADEALKTSQAKPRGRGVLLVFLVIFALGFAVIGSGMIVSGHAKEKGSILTEGDRQLQKSFPRRETQIQPGCGVSGGRRSSGRRG